MDQRAENKLFVRLFVGACALVAIMVLVYWLFGESLIRTYHEGKGIGIIPPDGNPNKGTFDAYRAKVAWRFWHNIVLGIPLSLLTIFGLYRLYAFLFARLREERELPGSSPDSTWVIVGAGILYAIITLVYFYPTLPTFATAMIGPAEDNMACIWTLAYGSRHLIGPGTSFVSDLFYPEGASFYYHAWSVYNLMLFSLLKPMFSAAASYNLLMMLTFPLSGLSAFMLIRYLTGNRWLALMGGFLFAFNPAHLERAQHHLNIATIQFLPLFVLYYVRCIRESSWRLLAAAGAALLLNAIVDWNYLLFGGWFMLFAYLYLANRRRRIWLPDVTWKSGLVLAVPLVVLSPWLAPMVRQALCGANTSAGGHNQFVVDLMALVVPNPLHFLGTWSPVATVSSTFTGMHWEGVGYLGLVALTLVIFVLRDVLSSGAKYLLGGLAFLVMALGSQPHLGGMMVPALMPGRLLPMIPLVSNARAPGRFMVFAYLFWSIVVSLAVGHLWRRIKRPSLRGPIVAALILLLVLDYTGISHETTAIRLPACYGSLPREGERYGLLDLPSGYVPVERYMMYQELHRIPIVQGWVSRKIERTLIDTLDYTDLSHQQRQLTEAKVRFVVLHKQYLPNDSINVENYRQTYPTTYEDTSNIVLQVY
jgi:hypothetical protein